MATYFTLRCGTCNGVVVYRKDKYVHYTNAKHDHDVVSVTSTKSTD